MSILGDFVEVLICQLKVTSRDRVNSPVSAHDLLRNKPRFEVNKGTERLKQCDCAIEAQ